MPASLPLPDFLRGAFTYTRPFEKQAGIACQFLGIVLAADGLTLVAASAALSGRTKTVRHPAAGNGQSAVLDAHMHTLIGANADGGVEI